MRSPRRLHLAAPLLAAALLLSLAPASAQTPKVGDKFPAFEGKGYDGQRVALADYVGKKAVLVDFWATWCGPCIAEIPNMKRAYELYHDKGFEIVGVSLDRSVDALRRYYENPQTTLPWKSTVDGKGWETELSNRFGIRSIPATFLLDENGTVVATNVRGSRLIREVAKLVDPENLPEDLESAMARYEAAATDADRAEAKRRLMASAEVAQDEVNNVAWQYLDSDEAQPARARLFYEMMMPTIKAGNDAGALDTAALASFIAGDAPEALRLQTMAMQQVSARVGNRFDGFLAQDPGLLEMRLREACYLLATGDGAAAKHIVDSTAEHVRKHGLESSRYYKYLAERMKTAP